MQQVAFTRNHRKYNRSDFIASERNEDLKALSESVIQRVYTIMSEDPWVVFWAAGWKDPPNHFRGRFDGPPLDLDRIKGGAIFPIPR